MHALAHWWQRWARGAVRHAWGMAPMGEAWMLAGLVRQSTAVVKVHTWAPWGPLRESEMTDLSGLSQHLRQHGRSWGGSHQRLNMALPKDFVHEGFIDLPLEMPEEEWLYEVQLDVAQSLQLAPDEVNFDFEPTKDSDGLVRRVHWVGCAQAQMAVFKNCIRAAGWRLAAVEIEHQAAQRAVRALQGGSVSLLTQAPQDWQFQLDRVASRSLYERIEPEEESSETIEQALEQIMRTPSGARLVAAGLALKGWH